MLRLPADCNILRRQGIAIITRGQTANVRYNTWRWPGRTPIRALKRVFVGIAEADLVLQIFFMVSVPLFIVILAGSDRIAGTERRDAR